MTLLRTKFFLHQRQIWPGNRVWCVQSFHSDFSPSAEGDKTNLNPTPLECQYSLPSRSKPRDSDFKTFTKKFCYFTGSFRLLFKTPRTDFHTWHQKKKNLNETRSTFRGRENIIIHHKITLNSSLQKSSTQMH